MLSESSALLGLLDVFHVFGGALGVTLTEISAPGHLAGSLSNQSDLFLSKRGFSLKIAFLAKMWVIPHVVRILRVMAVSFFILDRIFKIILKNVSKNRQKMVKKRHFLGRESRVANRPMGGMIGNKAEKVMGKNAIF